MRGKSLNKIDCCDRGFGPQPIRDRARRGPGIRSSTGITLGDILDATARLREEHRLCPDAFTGLHREDGTVDVTVVFEASIPLNAEDPLLMRRRMALAEYQQVQRHEATRQARMTAYMASKQQGTTPLQR